MSESNEIEYSLVGNIEDIPENSRLFIDFNDEPVVILNLAGQLYAIGDICTHDNGPLGDGELENFELVCPRHGARFDIRDGKAKRGPAFRDIPTYSIKQDGGKIFIGKK
ncbi:MAG: non-heme iron oxygenase ferredoxin subunit [Chloroflexi bacterium]|nr:non-heme iron oxygenase ferredoxin subunit [Chloroflexota bacterium]BCY18795.1 ferredoxin [Leptolinea sp. HRD-7]